MDIVIVADFCGKMDGSGNSRFIYLADMLSKKHKVEILTSDFDHGTKSYFSSIPSQYPFTITMVHEGKYNKNISLKRFYGHYIWGRNVKRYLNERKKPDIIYAAIPPLSGPLAAAKYCEKTGVKFIIDIQDLWPEAFQMVLNIPFVGNLMFAPIKKYADGIYRRADAVCAVSQTYVDRALCVNKKVHEGHAVYLGTDLMIFDQNVKEHITKKDDEGQLWIGYCGSLGDSYDLNVVIDALSILKNKWGAIPKFMVIGDGERRQIFENHARECGIDSTFTGKLPYSEMCGLLSACDIVVNPIVKGSAASIINKHADYASSGLPVINTQDSNEYRQLIEEYNMGLNCENGNAMDVANKLKMLLDSSEKRLIMGKNARRCAEEKFDRKTTYNQIIKEIESC